MRNFLSRISVTFLLVIMSCFAVAYAFADATVLAPQDFFSQVLASIQGFGGLTWVAKIAVIVTCIVASMKVTFLNNLIWSKLGSAQVWVAPILGLAAGILSMKQINLSGAFAYLSAGAGAIILHELLDSLKAIPGLGSVYVGIIGAVEGTLGGPAASGTTPPSA